MCACVCVTLFSGSSPANAFHNVKKEGPEAVCVCVCCSSSQFSLTDVKLHECRCKVVCSERMGEEEFQQVVFPVVDTWSHEKHHLGGREGGREGGRKGKRKVKRWKRLKIGTQHCRHMTTV